MSEEVVLRPEGELDLAGVDPLRATWFTLAESVAPGRIVVDLARVTFADATFVGLVVGLRKRQAAHAGTVEVCNARDQVRRLFTLTGLADLVGDPGAPGTRSATRSGVVDLRVPRPAGPRSVRAIVEHASGDA
jgi:anti-sigma B factor antagonist